MVPGSVAERGLLPWEDVAAGAPERSGTVIPISGGLLDMRALPLQLLLLVVSQWWTCWPTMWVAAAAAAKTKAKGSRLLLLVVRQWRTRRPTTWAGAAVAAKTKVRAAMGRDASPAAAEGPPATFALPVGHGVCEPPEAAPVARTKLSRERPAQLWLPRGSEIAALGAKQKKAWACGAGLPP